MGNRSGSYGCYKLYFNAQTLISYLDNLPSTSSKSIDSGTFIESSNISDATAYGTVRYNINNKK